LSDLPAGWEWATIAEIADVVGGIQKSPKRRPARNAHPMLRVANVRDGHLALDDVHQIELFAGELERLSLKAGDCLVVEGNGSISQVGRAAMWRGEIADCVHQNHILRARPLIAPSFLAYWMMSRGARDQIERVASSTSGLHVLSGSKLRQLVLPVPGLQAQQRIVAAIDEQFSHLDAAETALISGQTRLTGFWSAMTSKALRGDWPVVRLGDHTIEQRYGSSAKAGPDGDVPVLRMGNIVDGQLDFADLKYLHQGDPDLDTCTLTDGDLLFNRTNSPELVGKSAVFEGRATRFAFASYLIRVRLDDQLDPRWVATAINSPAGRRYIDAVRTQQVGQANVNGTKLRGFPVPMPPIEVQRERSAQLDRAQARFRAVESEINRARTRAAALRRSILAAAFSGKLVRQDRDDEPGSVMLEGIRHERALATRGRRNRAHAVSP